jgi:hypothetical protein
VTGAVVSTGAAVAVGCVVAVALLVSVGLTVAFFVATGFALCVAKDDEAGAEEPVPVVPITEPPAMFIELVVES